MALGTRCAKTRFQGHPRMGTPSPHTPSTTTGHPVRSPSEGGFREPEDTAELAQNLVAERNGADSGPSELAIRQVKSSLCVCLRVGIAAWTPLLGPRDSHIQVQQQLLAPTGEQALLWGRSETGPPPCGFRAGVMRAGFREGQRPPEREKEPDAAQGPRSRTWLLPAAVWPSQHQCVHSSPDNEAAPWRQRGLGGREPHFPPL